jgi:hypothetical protein
MTERKKDVGAGTRWVIYPPDKHQADSATVLPMLESALETDQEVEQVIRRFLNSLIETHVTRIIINEYTIELYFSNNKRICVYSSLAYKESNCTNISLHNIEKGINDFGFCSIIRHRVIKYDVINGRTSKLFFEGGIELQILFDKSLVESYMLTGVSSESFFVVRQ